MPPHSDPAQLMFHYKSSCGRMNEWLWWMSERQRSERFAVIKAAKPFLITAAYDLSLLVWSCAEQYWLHWALSFRRYTQHNISFELDFKPSFINDSHNYFIGWCRLPSNLSALPPESSSFLFSLLHDCTSTHTDRYERTHHVWHHINVIEHILSIKIWSSHTFNRDATKWWIISD